jgi:hypothetical protein
MNTENIEYLQKSLLNLGFGDMCNEELRSKIQQNLPEFSLKTQAEYNKEKLEATLYFKKSESTGMYFFNKYNTSLKSDTQPEKTHTFYINKGWGVTFKEAYNLLNENAVYKSLTTKEGEPYTAWLKLDLTQKDENHNYKMEKYHQNYGYDLQKVLAQYPIQELKNKDAKEMLIKSLEKGNRQSVTMELTGLEEKFFIRANPKEKTLDVFERRMRPVEREEIKVHTAKNRETGTKDIEQDVGKEVKKEAGKLNVEKKERQEAMQKPKSRRMSH